MAADCLPHQVSLLQFGLELGLQAVHENMKTAPAPVAASPAGVPLRAALAGLDFWLLFFMQLAVFGGGVGANQNLALIFESARSPASLRSIRLTRAWA